MAVDEARKRTEEQFRLLVEGVVEYAIYMLDLPVTRPPAEHIKKRALAWRLGRSALGVAHLRLACVRCRSCLSAAARHIPTFLELHRYFWSWRTSIDWKSEAGIGLA